MWPNPQFPADLVTFTEEILNGKLHFLCSKRQKNLVVKLKQLKVEFRCFDNYDYSLTSSRVNDILLIKLHLCLFNNLLGTFLKVRNYITERCILLHYVLILTRTISKSIKIEHLKILKLDSRVGWPDSF